jgi:hypothetical protein
MCRDIITEEKVVTRLRHSKQLLNITTIEHATEERCYLFGPCRGYIKRTSCQYEGAMRRQLEESEFGVRWPPACKDVSPGAEERPLLEEVTKQRNGDRDWEQ